MKTFSEIRENLEQKAHPFELSGLGLAPFQFVAMISLPSPGMAEQNTTAYNNAMRGAGEQARRYGVHLGMCQHCGMGLMHNCVIKSKDGKYSIVGSSCVAKTHDTGLGNAVAVADAKRLREIRQQKRAAEQAERHRKWLEANKDRLEKEQQARDQAEAKRKEQQAKVRDALSFLLPYLKDAPYGSFKHSMAQTIEAGEFPRGRAWDILGDIYAKAHGRANSNAYNQAYDEFDRRTDKVRPQ